jgi:erythromycin esterase
MRFGAGLSIFVLLLFAVGSCVFAAGQPPDADAVKQWLTSHAIPVKTVEAGHGLEDLEPLKKVLKNVRLVGLGEGTHGSREFFQFKHRMLEFLVKDMGFTVFAIEASYPACWNINEYVLHGKGERAKALASQGFWTWDTNEVSDMIDWMREYNQKVPEDKKVRFLGFDLQHLDRAVEVVEEYIKKVAPDDLSTAEESLQPFRLPQNEYMARPEEEKDKSTEKLLGLLGFLAFHETRFIRMTSAAEFNEALQEARTLAQYDESYGHGMGPSARAGRAGGALRDLYMAENIEYLVNSPPAGTRMVIWAHNGHIGFHAYGGGTVSMGAHLKKMYGDSYYALGFTMYEGAFQSRDMAAKPGSAGILKEFSIPASPEGSVGWYLNLPGIERFVVDLRSAPKEGPVADWLRAPHPMTSIGSGFGTNWTVKQYMAPTELRDAYDGLFFIRKTTRARPNPTGVR